jgi:hypothetical protein
VSERADQADVVVWLVDEEGLEPGRDAFEVVVAGGQDAGLDEQRAQEHLGPVLGQRVEVVVSDSLLAAREFSQ